ncbi:MAG: 2-amino-4-hydroxy-6-hydroxymethyldihydropteridine diphosphokinase [Candidatus Fermentibacteraceae bacterium]
MSRDEGGRLALSLGSNSGPRRELLEAAAGELAESLELAGLRLSGLFETEPWGGASGPAYLNCVLTGRTRLGPMKVLQACRRVEAAAGSRVRKAGAPRRLDVDVLCMEDAASSPPDLELPHPRMHLRRFVLLPLAQVWDGEVPGLGETPQRLLEGAADSGEAVELKPPPPPGATAWREGE